MTTKVQNAVVHELSDFATNVSQKITETGDRYAELCRVEIISMLEIGNVSLEELRGVSHQLDTHQLQQQTRDDMLLGKVMELINSTSQSQLPVLSKYEDIRNTVGENISQLQGALVMVKQGQNQLVEFVTNDLRQQIEVLALESREVIANNLSLQLTKLGEVWREKLVEMKNSTTTAIEKERVTLQSKVNDSISQVLGILANISRSHDRQQAVYERAEEQLQLLRVVALDSRELVANNLSTYLASIEQSCVEVSSDCEEAVQAQAHVRNEVLGRAVEEIQNTVSENISHILGALMMVKQRQDQLFVEVEKEMEMKANTSLILSEESHAELVGQITDRSDEIRSQLTQFQEEVRRRGEQMLNNDCSSSNITAKLAEIESSCVSVASDVNTAKAMLAQKFEEQRHILLDSSRLLEAVNETLVMSAEQSLQQHSAIARDIATQRQTIITQSSSVRSVLTQKFGEQRRLLETLSQTVTEQSPRPGKNREP